MRRPQAASPGETIDRNCGAEEKKRRVVDPPLASPVGSSSGRGVAENFLARPLPTDRENQLTAAA
jgi:hypothetical protein